MACTPGATAEVNVTTIHMQPYYRPCACREGMMQALLAPSWHASSIAPCENISTLPQRQTRPCLNGEHHAHKASGEQRHAERARAHQLQLLHCVAQVDLACAARARPSARPQRQRQYHEVACNRMLPSDPHHPYACFVAARRHPTRASTLPFSCLPGANTLPWLRVLPIAVMGGSWCSLRHERLLEGRQARGSVHPTSQDAGRALAAEHHCGQGPPHPLGRLGAPEPGGQDCACQAACQNRYQHCTTRAATVHFGNH